MHQRLYLSPCSPTFGALKPDGTFPLLEKYLWGIFFLLVAKGFNHNHLKFFHQFLDQRVPAPRLPTLSLFTSLIGDALTIALVSYALNISMAKYFAKKHNYEIRPNQVCVSF